MVLKWEWRRITDDKHSKESEVTERKGERERQLQCTRETQTEETRKGISNGEESKGTESF